MVYFNANLPTMGRHNGSKLNQLLREWPSGTVAVYSWLESRGIDRKLVQKYKKNRWLDVVGAGAFARLGDKVDWRGGLYAIQEQLGLSVHVGGKTALQLLGLAHYLPLGAGGRVTLFGSPGDKMPAWFSRHKWGVKIFYTTPNLFSSKPDLGLTKLDAGAFQIQVSAPERAIMEILHLVPQDESFDESNKLMEGLTTLRPALVQSLLETCTSIKVKRLFMFMAEELNHPWVKKVRLSRVDFGEGKRVIVEGGRFDPKYKITVPRVSNQS